MTKKREFLNKKKKCKNFDRFSIVFFLVWSAGREISTRSNPTGNRDDFRHCDRHRA